MTASASLIVSSSVWVSVIDDHHTGRSTVGDDSGR
jgi:hypothetical protein